MKRIFYIVRYARQLLELERGYVDDAVILDAIRLASSELFNSTYGASKENPNALVPMRSYQRTRAVSEALQPFKREAVFTAPSASQPGTLPLDGGLFVMPEDAAHATAYRVPGAKQTDFVNDNQLDSRLASPINGPTLDYPIVHSVPGGYQVLPVGVPAITVPYLCRPTDPVYAIQRDANGDIVTENGEPAFDDAASVDTGWLPEEEPELLWRALFILGVPNRDAAVQQFAQVQTQKGS